MMSVDGWSVLGYLMRIKGMVGKFRDKHCLNMVNGLLIIILQVNYIEKPAGRL